MSRIEFSGRRLTIDSKYIVDLPYPIQEAFETKNVIVVFMNPDTISHQGELKGMVKNLLGFDLRGNKLWEAELPRNSRFDIHRVQKGLPSSRGGDYYWKVARRDPLIVYSFSSYECKINEATGKIESAEFYK